MSGSLLKLKDLFIFRVTLNIFYCSILIGYYTVLCTIWKDIVLVRIVLKTRIGLDAAGLNNLQVPHPKSEYFKRTFLYSGTNLWNSLPSNIKSLNNEIWRVQYLSILYNNCIITYLVYSWNGQYYNNNFMKKYLRQPSIDFDFCNVSSSCDVVYRGRWLTQAGYWFILRFCEHFTC
jgi:hypothetical protein